jgi:putative membrane protein
MKCLSTRSAAALAAAVISLGTGSAALAQSNPALVPASQAPGSTIPNLAGMTDTAFVQQFTLANNAEIAEASYVIRHTQNPVVRAFAQHMIDDHSTAAVKIRETAREVSPPAHASTDVAPDAQLALANLRTLSEPMLDRVYMREQIVDHNNAIALLDYEAEHGSAPSVRSFASNTRPIVLGHLGMIEAYEATGGRSTEVSAAGVIYPGVMPGAVTPNNAPNGTPGNNPGVVSNGTTNGSGNGSGGTRGGNTVANPNSPPGAATNSAPQQNTTPMPAASP